MKPILCLLLILVGYLPGLCQDLSELADLSSYSSESGIIVETHGDSLQVSWPIDDNRFGFITFQTNDRRNALIRSMGILSGTNRLVLAEDLDPQFAFWLGERDLEKRDGWTIFFDRPNERPYGLERAQLAIQKVTVSSSGNRCVISFSGLEAIEFKGSLDFTFYPGGKLIRMEAAVSTDFPNRALLYNAGFTNRSASISSISWQSPEEGFKTLERNRDPASPLRTAFRSVIAGSQNGSLGIFPPPHQFLYPLDFAENYDYNWSGTDYLDVFDGFGFGIRQPPQGDRRWVPWINAPPGSVQKLGLFMYIDDQSPEQVLEQIKDYTHSDRFVDVPGYKKFTSHYHIEHSLDFLEKQEEYRLDGVPKGLKNPEFVQVFKEMDVDIVHLAEFHKQATPGLKLHERMKQLEIMYTECARLSSEEFLLLPGEEANVQLGGHWISFFPRPVNWVLNREEGVPFYQETDLYGPVYHVGDTADILRLFEEEGGLMWTAHPRIKGSTNFPDQYKNEPFFESQRFLGAAWKAMPADFSKPYLGDDRVLGLLDDMSNWGERKYLVGEVDIFKIFKGYELYGTMNMNYIKLDKIPSFDDGWGSVLDVLRAGDFFVTTGEVLLSEYDIEGEASGGILKSGKKRNLTAKLNWTFPMNYAEIIMGDGQEVYRKRIDLSTTQQYGEQEITYELDLRGMRWVRFEAWDIAANGVFTQPIWIE